jgi:ferredoxin-NADP reductase
MLQLKVEAIKWELPDTATFFFSEADGKAIRYKAGQFITFIFAHHRQEIRRSYSLSSSPDESLLSVTIKRIPNGEISRFLLTKVKVGDVLNAVEPAGRFIVSDFEAEKDIFFFAAGSGIVPVFSQLKYILMRAGKSRVTLIYSSKNQDAVLFKADLDALAAIHPGRLKIIYLLSSNASRLNNLIAEKLVRENIHFDMNEAAFYLCGPFEYMRMVKLTLGYMGIEPPQVRKETFVLETVPVTGGVLNFAPRKIRIHFNGEMHDLLVGENQSILQAALQNNIQLPYSCGAGICSSCIALCKSGKVTMVKNEILMDTEVEEGWILTCTGHPLTDDVFIEYPARA